MLASVPFVGPRSRVPKNVFLARLGKDVLKILLQPGFIHLNTGHSLKHALKLAESNLDGIEHVRCYHQSFLNISCVRHSESWALIEGHGERVLANDANRSEFNLNCALPVVAIAQQ